MLSTLDPNRQANEVIFSRKSKFSSYPPLSSPLLLSPLTFNNSDFKKCSHQKHLGSILDSKLDFNTRVDNKIKKCYQIICLIKKTVRKCTEKSFTYYLQILHQTTSRLWRYLI